MPDHSLHDIYSTVQPDYKHVYVVPLIRYDFPKSDYLYLLYSPFTSTSSDTTIHSISIYSHWKFVIAQIVGRKPILHYHWLEFQDAKSLLGMIYKIKMIWLYKLIGGKIVWTIHNLSPHDGKWLSVHLKLHRWMAKISNRILVHSKSQIGDVCKKYKVLDEKIEVYSHPTLPADIFDKSIAVGLLNRRFNLTLDSESLIFGSFGAISAYKNFEATIRTLKQINFEGKFLIFGYLKKGHEELGRQLEMLSRKYEWLEYYPGFVEEKDIPAIMNSIDYCIFNFKEISTSGGVEMALSYKKRIIAPRKGILSDYESESNVQLFSDEKELVSILENTKD